MRPHWPQISRAWCCQVAPPQRVQRPAAAAGRRSTGALHCPSCYRAGAVLQFKLGHPHCFACQAAALVAATAWAGAAGGAGYLDLVGVVVKHGLISVRVRSILWSSAEYSSRGWRKFPLASAGNGQVAESVSSRRAQYRRSTTRAASTPAVIAAASDTPRAGIAALERLWRCASGILTGRPHRSGSGQARGVSRTRRAGSGESAHSRYRRSFIPAAVLRYGHPRFRAVWTAAAGRSQGWSTSCSPTSRFVAMNDGPSFGSQLTCYLAGAGLGVDRPPRKGPCVELDDGRAGVRIWRSLPGRQAGETTDTTWAFG